MQTLLYQGWLNLRSYGEADDILFLSSLSDPLAEQLQEDISNKQVSVRYWITDKQVTKEEANEAIVSELMGLATTARHHRLRTSAVSANTYGVRLGR